MCFITEFEFSTSVWSGLHVIWSCNVLKVQEIATIKKNIYIKNCWIFYSSAEHDCLVRDKRAWACWADTIWGQVNYTFVTDKQNYCPRIISHPVINTSFSRYKNDTNSILILLLCYVIIKTFKCVMSTSSYLLCFTW